MLAGLQFAYSEYKGDFGNGGGDFKLREPMLTAYAGYGEGPWYVGATLGLGSLDYSTNRNIALGAATRTRDRRHERLSQRRRACSAATGSSTSDWDHGPFAKLTYEKIVVRQFSENGSDSTALTYDQQEPRRDLVEPRLAGRRQHRAASVRSRARRGSTTSTATRAR